MDGSCDVAFLVLQKFCLVANLFWRAEFTVDLLSVSYIGKLERYMPFKIARKTRFRVLRSSLALYLYFTKSFHRQFLSYGLIRFFRHLL